MLNRRYGRVRCSDDQPSLHIHVGRHGRKNISHETGGEDGRHTRQAGPATVQEIYPEQSQAYINVRRAEEGSLRYPASRTAVLEKSYEQFGRMGFLGKSLRLVCSKKTFGGEQLTMVWNVENLKISHVDPNLLTALLRQLSKRYVKRSDLTV